MAHYEPGTPPGDAKPYLTLPQPAPAPPGACLRRARWVVCLCAEASLRFIQQGITRAYTHLHPRCSMARLHDKGLLARRRDGKTDYYTPAYERDEYMALRAQAGVEELVAQYGDVALSHFAQQMACLDPARRRAIQRLSRQCR